VRPGPLHQQVQPLLDLGGLQQAELVLDLDPGRVPGGVGELPGLAHPLHGVQDLPGRALLQDRDEQGLELARELPGARRRRRLRQRFGLHPQRGAGSGHAGADPRPLGRAQDGGGLTAGQPADLGHLGDRAHHTG